MIIVSGYMHELKTLRLKDPIDDSLAFRTVFQVLGELFFASTHYDRIDRRWETMIFKTAQPPPNDPREINPKLVTDWRGEFRRCYLEEPTIDWHEKAIEDFAQRKIDAREGKIKSVIVND